MWTTLYLRSTISPSPATKTSSPCERNTFLGSPGLLAKPKNLSGMGGGGGCCGVWYASATLVGSVVPGVMGLGITTSAWATKMFRPEPSYNVFSVAFSKSKRSVGSRFSITGAFLLFLPPGCGVCLDVGAAACAFDAGSDDPPQKIGTNS